VHGTDAIIGNSEVQEKLLQKVGQVAKTDTTVLISGETGTGKELIARAIHAASQREHRPLVKVNCAALPAGLIESELFGHEKGAFTGATARKIGRFELADGGTIFLDEIGDLALELQAKLLRVLQEYEVDRVGGKEPVPIDVRVISTTNVDIKQSVSEKKFREDLFYRLNVLPIKLPPLRNRPEDIPLLSQHFIDKFSISLDKEIKGITSAAMSILLKHSWPGNVRELENAIERAVILAEGKNLVPANFPAILEAESLTDNMDDLLEEYSIKVAQKILEERLITRALVKTGGNRTRAARLLEISHPSLLSKIKVYNILM